MIGSWPLLRAEETIAAGDAGTVGKTLPWMRQLVQEGRSDPRVAQAAQNLASQHPRLHPIEAVFRYAQSLPYVYDEDLLKRAGYGDDASELLQGAPYQLAQGGAAEGDCDDRAILVQSLLESIGYKTRFVLVRGPQRADFSHVYSEVEDAPGHWTALDAIFNGHGGRPVFGVGSEVGPAEGARDKVTVPVDAEPVSGLWLLGLAAAFFWLKGGHS